MMDESLAEWLRLREAADHQSRSETVLDAVQRRVLADGPIRVLDLATGTGSNLRYLIPRLPPTQRWLVVDRSPVLLAHLRTRTIEWSRAQGLEARETGEGLAITGPALDCHITTRVQDLDSVDLPDLFDGRHLVTASALLDLVSGTWLSTLAARCRAARAAALLTLTYDGHSTCEPREPEDAMVRAAFNRHQARDKGLGGPAAGPNAASTAVRAFADLGFEVRSETSDWQIEPDARAFQTLLIDGWASAATEETPEAAGVFADWRARRLAHVAEGRSRLTVGHRDVGAWLER